MKTVLDIATEEKNKQTEAKLLKEWKPEHFKFMQLAIISHFNYKYFSGRHCHYQPEYRGWQRLSEIFGFAYTSSSDFAGYWVCNDEIVTSKYPGFHYVGFVMAETGEKYALLMDNKENDIYITL